MIAAVAGARAAAEDGAADLVRTFVEAADTLAQEKGATPAEDLAAWRGLVASSLDVPSIARFVVGPSWRAARDDQRAALAALIEGRIAAFYAQRARAEEGGAFTLLGTEPLGPGETLVSSRLTHADGSAESIDWRVSLTEAGLRIRDIVADGQSLAAAKRAECTAILQRNRGSLDALIDALALGLADERG